MFTGIIRELGTVSAITPSATALRLTVAGTATVATVQHGDSIAVSGTCLTVIEHDGVQFSADVMAETLARTTIGALRPGDRVNLENAARFGDPIGGHIVQGHVDGTGRVLAVTPGEAWRVLRIELSEALAPFVAAKGSIAVDGVSLTVSMLGGPGSEDEDADAGTGAGNGADATSWFEVSLIPETLAATTLGTRVVGDRLNLETDILARHVARLLSRTPNGGLTASEIQA